MRRPYPYLWVAAAVAGVVLARLLGPSDIYPDSDQVRAMHQAADVVLSGRWIAPDTGSEAPPRHPPLLAWLSAAGPAVGLWQAWAFKLPTILAGATMVGLTVAVARRMAARLVRQMRRSYDERASDWTPQRLAVVAALSGIAVAATPIFMRYVYQVRIEMLTAALLTAAWSSATAALWPTNRRRVLAVAFWGSVGLAGLAQGWVALLPVAYAALAARLIHGRWSAVARLHPRAGVPLALLVVSVWLVPAALSGELAAMARRGLEHRLAAPEGGWMWSILSSPVRLGVWLFERYSPWSVAAAVALAWMTPRRWLRSPLGPAVLWLGLLLGVFAVLPQHGPGDLLATLPPLVCVAVLFLAVDQPRVPVPLWAIGALAGVTFLLTGGREVTFSSVATRGAGEVVQAFAVAAEQRAAGEAVSFTPGARATPVAPLMARRAQIQEASPWVVDLVWHRGAQPIEAELHSSPLARGEGGTLHLVLRRQ